MVIRNYANGCAIVHKHYINNHRSMQVLTKFREIKCIIWILQFITLNVIHLIINMYPTNVVITYDKYVLRVGDFDGIKIENVGLLKTAWTALKPADIDVFIIWTLTIKHIHTNIHTYKHTNLEYKM